jgi:hypothetical protein
MVKTTTFFILLWMQLMASNIALAQKNECLILQINQSNKKYYCAGSVINLKLKHDFVFSIHKIEAVFPKHIKTEDAIIDMEEIEIIKFEKKSSLLRVAKTGTVPFILAGALIGGLDFLRHQQWDKFNTTVFFGGIGIGTTLALIPKHRKIKINKKHRIKTTHFY